MDSQQANLNSTLKDLRKEVRATTLYLHEQEELIKVAIELGNNHIHQLTLEADDLVEAINESKHQLIIINNDIDNRRFILLSMF